MSETVKDWNTKEIRAFKEAFGRHKAEQKERGGFSATSPERRHPSRITVRRKIC